MPALLPPPVDQLKVKPKTPTLDQEEVNRLVTAYALPPWVARCLCAIRVVGSEKGWSIRAGEVAGVESNQVSMAVGRPDAQEAIRREARGRHYAAAHAELADVAVEAAAGRAPKSKADVLLPILKSTGILAPDELLIRAEIATEAGGEASALLEGSGAALTVECLPVEAQAVVEGALKASRLADGAGI